MGRVYRINDALHPDRKVALKTLSAAFLTPTRVELFKAEFRTMAELAHPNIAKVYDFETVTADSEYAFTMEFVIGTQWLEAARDQALTQIPRLDGRRLPRAAIPAHPRRHSRRLQAPERDADA